MDDYFSIGGRVTNGHDSEADSGVGIGATPFRAAPMPNDFNVEKGDRDATGGVKGGGAYEGHSETGLSLPFSARTTSVRSDRSSPMASNANSIYVPDTKSSLDSSRSQPSTNDEYAYLHTGSPTFSYSSSPETMVSFNFSPVQHQHFLDRADSGYSYISSAGSRNDDLNLQPCQRPAPPEDILMTPSSSYASTSTAPASFPFQDRIGSLPDKGKGKQRETRSPTPTLRVFVEDDSLTEVELDAQGTISPHIQDLEPKLSTHDGSQPGLNGRGRSTSRARGKLKSLRRALTDVNVSFSEQRARTVSGSGAPIPSGSRPALTPFRSEYPPVPHITVSQQSRTVANGMSSNVVDGGYGAGRITLTAPSVPIVKQDRLGSPRPTHISRVNTPSFRLHAPVEGARISLTPETELLSASPMPSPSSLPPPRLKFVGRANTAPSLPFIEVSSTVASGSSSSALTTALLMGPGSSSQFHSHNNARSQFMPAPSGLISATSSAYTYIYTLPPLTRPIPQPDGCGQILLEEPLVAPEVVLVSASPFSSTRSRAKLMAGRCPWDLFDTLLPYELRVEVFRTLLRSYINEHDALMMSQEWSVGMAGGTMDAGMLGKREQRQKVNAARWVGLERGLKELVRLSRVSREWQALSLDGQLWATISFSKFPNMPTSLIHRVTRSVGPFMKTFDLSGVSGISPSVFIDLVDNIRGARETSVPRKVGYEDERDGAEPQANNEERTVNFLQPSPPKFYDSSTQLTSISLQGCSALTTRALHHLLTLSPLVEHLVLRGLNAVTNATCELIGESCSSRLVKLDLGKCPSMSASGVEDMISTINHHSPAYRSFSSAYHPRYRVPARRFPKLRDLRLGGLKRITGQTMFSIGWGIPDLEVLDISGTKTLTDEDLGVFVKWDDRFDDTSVLLSQTSTSLVRSRDAATHLQNVQPYEQIMLTSRQMGFNPLSADKYFKRLTRLRHLSISSCPLITDMAAGHIAFAVPRLKFLEMGGIGAGVRDLGLVMLLETTPFITRVDLEDAIEITDAVLSVLTPPPPPPRMDQRRRDVDLASGRTKAAVVVKLPNPGELLEQIVLSYAGHLTDAALLSMINSCTKLKVMEVDNTRASDVVVKEFVKACRRRQIEGAEVVAVDCRNVTKSVVSEGTGLTTAALYVTRNRRGYRAWEARALGYYDERDKRDQTSAADAISNGSGTVVVGNECDERRVVVKSFHSWQAVDNMTEAREKRRKALIAGASKNAVDPAAGDSSSSSGGEGTRTPRWLSWRSMSSNGVRTPGGGAGVGGGMVPRHGDPFSNLDTDDRGCVIM
ncbi:hypothetical protein FRB96_006903 [Tulasnella sp. 330]|nr:hypothetical protein FRB96_006903 [Tulasnella sp. 330]